MTPTDIQRLRALAEKADMSDLDCPFCSSDHIVRSTDLRTGDYDMMCTQCGATAPGDVWNTRAGLCWWRPKGQDQPPYGGNRRSPHSAGEAVGLPVFNL